MDYLTVEVRKDNGTGWVVINRPEVKNAFNSRSFDEISGAIEQLSQDQEVRTIIFIGKGDNFSSGRDFLDTNVPPDFEERRSKAFTAVEYCPKPTIAAVSGYAITGGLTLALAYEIVIASDEAIF